MAVRVHCYRYLRLFRYSSLGTRGSCEPVFRWLCRMHLVPCSDRPCLGRSYQNRLPKTRRGQYDDCVEERRWGIFTRWMLQMCHTLHCSNWALGTPLGNSKTFTERFRTTHLRFALAMSGHRYSLILIYVFRLWFSKKTCYV